MDPSKGGLDLQLLWLFGCIHGVRLLFGKLFQQILPLLILASTEMQWAIAVLAWKIISSFPFSICILSCKSGLHGTVEWRRKHSLYWSFSVRIEFTIWTQFLIWCLGLSYSEISSETYPITPLFSVIWWFLLFSIKTGKQVSDWV